VPPDDDHHSVTVAFSKLPGVKVAPACVVSRTFTWLATVSCSDCWVAV
jgi:hypothetical protein